MYTTSEMIENALRNAYACRRLFGEAQAEYEHKKYFIEREQALATARGEIVGKNPDERKAAIFIKYDEDLDELDSLREEADRLKINYDLATLEVTRVKMLLRLDECLAYGSPKMDDIHENTN